MINFLHTNVPEPIMLSLGFLTVHWYGFLMLMGGVVALGIGAWLAPRYNIKREDIYDLAFYWAIFAILGARIYYVIYAWEFYSQAPLDIFKIWEGGLAVHGVLIGGFTATIIFAWKKKINFWILADVVAVGFALGQVVGRWGNYFNEEIFGKPTSLPWGLPIEIAKRPVEFISDKFFHPTVLYESLMMILVFGVLAVAHYLRLKKGNKFFAPGTIFLSYVIFYAIIRFGLEFLRTDFSPLVFGVRWAQIISVVLLFGAIFLFIGARKANKSLKY